MATKKNWIDGMKGIAICGVVMVHSGGANLPFPIGKIAGLGQFGVQLFFMISAYLTFLSIEKHISNEFNLKNAYKWVISKIVRLIPLWYLALLLYTVLIGGNSWWLGSEGKISLGNFLTHILFLHGLFPHYTDSIMGVEWYLGVLVLFYIISPLLYKVIKNLRSAIIAWMIGSILGFLFVRVALQLMVQMLLKWQNIREPSS